MNLIELRAFVNSRINTKVGTDKISGADHNEVLNMVIDSLIEITGTGFGGDMATGDNPGAQTNPIFFLASEVGTYTYCAGLKVTALPAFIIWDGSKWKLNQIGVPTEETPDTGLRGIARSGDPEPSNPQVGDWYMYIDTAELAWPGSPKAKPGIIILETNQPTNSWVLVPFGDENESPVDVNTFSLEVSILNSVQYLSDYHQDKELSFEKGSCTYIGGIYYLITHTNGTKINFTDDFIILKNDYSSFLPGEYLCKFTYLPNTNISVEVIGLNVIRNFGEFNDAIDSNIKFEVPISELSTDENLTFDFEIKSTSNSINPQVFWDISINYFFLGYTPSSNTILINGPSVKGYNEFPLSQIDQLADGQWHRITVSFPCSSKNSSYFLIDGVADEGFVSAPGLGATTWGVLVGSDFTLSFGAYATENKDIESFEGYMRNLKLTLGEKILIDCPNPANGENAGALNDGIVTNIK